MKPLLRRLRHELFATPADALLSVGLLLGGLMLRLLDPALPLGLPLDPQQVQSLPALVLLVLGALLIA